MKRVVLIILNNTSSDIVHVLLYLTIFLFKLSDHVCNPDANGVMCDTVIVTVLLIYLYVPPACGMLFTRLILK